MEKKRDEREKKNEDISLECQHFGVGNENTNLVIYDILKPMRPTNGANSNGTSQKGKTTSINRRKKKSKCRHTTIEIQFH